MEATTRFPAALDKDEAAHGERCVLFIGGQAELVYQASFCVRVKGSYTVIHVLGRVDPSPHLGYARDIVGADVRADSRAPTKVEYVVFRMPAQRAVQGRAQTLALRDREKVVVVLSVALKGKGSREQSKGEAQVNVLVRF